MKSWIRALLFVTAVMTFACDDRAPTQEELRAEVEASLAAFAADLAESRPGTTSAYADRLRTYLDAHPAFYGSAVALLDRDGRVKASPYVYRTTDGYVEVDLAVPSYDIDSQAWITAPLAAGTGVWTEPYFDAGGGEIWMVTRSVPVRDGQGIVAIVTTDLPVEAPGSSRLPHQPGLTSVARGPRPVAGRDRIPLPQPWSIVTVALCA